MMKSLLASAAVALSLFAGAASAAPISPTSQLFGDIDTATTTPVTFGGTGIPTARTAYSIFTDGVNTLLLGLTAHQRFSNPALTDDGKGTFTATAGANDGFGGPGTAATWNFAWFAEATGGKTLSDWGLKLLYDLDPGADTDSSDLGTINFAGFPFGLSQGSQNATFGFLAITNPAFGITAPTFTPFNPLSSGEYTFALTTTSGNMVAIQVNVPPVPVPAALPLMLLALGGLGLAARRRRAA